MTTTDPTTPRTTTTTTTSAWRTAVAAAGPALLAVVGILSPVDDSDEPAERLTDLFAHEATYNVALLCLVASLLLLVPTALWLRDAVPGGGRRAATTGATLAAAGFMLFAVATGSLGFAPAAWATLPAAEQEHLLPAFTAMDEGKGPLGLVLTGPLLPILGLGTLATGLWRHTSSPRAALVGLPLGWAVFLFSPSNVGKTIGPLLMLAAVITVLRPTNHHPHPTDTP